MSARLGAIGLVSVLTGVVVAALVAPFVVLLQLSAKVAAQGVDILPMDLDTQPLPQRSLMLDRKGRVIARFYDKYRISVPLDQVAPVMRDAIVAIEDHRFYEHRGFDLEATVRALLTNTVSSNVLEGGSTITQQLVKLTRLAQASTGSERAAVTAESYTRKLKELRYALALEREHDKDWILERYLNTAYFGDGAHGIEAAARHFFSRPASQLLLHQAALLAGLVKSPSWFDPIEYPDRARARRDVVLSRMAATGAITHLAAETAQRRGLELKVRRLRNGCVTSRAPFFCAYVRRFLLEDEALGRTRQERLATLQTGGLTIRTTFDRQFQRAADRSVRRHVDARDRAVGALAMVRPQNGSVRALAQSRPMGRRKLQGQTFLNYTVPTGYGDANGFQAGSTFKVFVLAAAISQGVPLSAEIQAPARLSIPVERFRGCGGPLISEDSWDVENSTGSGTFDLYTGTRQSVNTFFAQLELRTGLCRPYRLAKRMGIDLDDPDNQQVPSFTLGVADTDPLTMASAYGTFAARGIHCAPRPVRAVLDANGQPLKRYRPKCHRVMPTHVADAVNDVLRGVQEPGGFGHGAGLALEVPSAAKTGTIERNMAVWYVGYTPTLATASVIAGANRDGHWVTLNGQTIGGTFVRRAFGSTNAGPMWADAMKAVQHRLPAVDFQMPDPTRVRGVHVQVPDLVGQSLDDARLLLLERGLNWKLEGAKAAPRARVESTRPTAGSTVGSGSDVTLFISPKRPPQP